MSLSIDERMKKVNNSTMKDDEKDRSNKVLSLQREMIDARNQELDRWEDDIKRAQFENDIDEDGARFGKSNIRIPLEFAFIESKSADELDTLPFLKILAVKDNDTMLSQAMQEVMDFVLNKVVNIKEVLYRMHMKQKNVLGDGLIKVYWLEEFRNVKIPKVKTNKDGEKVITYKSKKVKVYDNVKLDLVDCRQFLIDPIAYQAGKTLNDANHCEFVSLYKAEDFEQIFSNRVGYKNLDLVRGGTYTRVTDESIPSEDEQDARVRENYVEVVEHWDVLNDELIVLANDIEIRHTPVPYYDPKTGAKALPVAHFVDHMSATGFWNISEVDLIRDMTEERETQRNINIDAAKGYTHPFIAVGGMNDMDIDEFAWGINSVMEVDDVNQMKQFSMSGNTGLPFNLENANLEDCIMTTGHDIRGILGSPGQTATQTLERKESQVKRTKLTSFYNEVNGYRRLYTLVKNLILQFYTPEQIEEILGKSEKSKQFLKYKDQILKNDYEIMIVSNNQIPATREIKKLRNQETLATIGALPFNEQGQLPPPVATATRPVLIENLEIAPELVDTILGTSELSPTPDSADAALDTFEQMVEGTEESFNTEGGFTRTAPQANSVGGGSQQQMQADLEGVLPQ